MRKLVLGLDIGVASVGWGIIDATNGEVIDTGVRLFSSRDASANEDRRINRQSRRLTRRKKHRRERIKHLLMENGISTCNKVNENPYELRVKGLHEELEVSEIYTALMHLAKRRGISYLDDVIEEGAIKSEHLKENMKELESGKLPCEIQLERFEKYGQVRGIIEIEDHTDNSSFLVNIFPTKSYIDEARKILSTQQAFHKQITDDFINKFIEIMTSKREYFIGPGNENSRTDYGVYRTNGETWDNLFEILIGKCSVFPEETRAARSSYVAQEFNLLNDLNNLKISGLESGKLSKDHKHDIINKVKNSKKMGTKDLLKYIASICDCEIEDIQGYGIDKNRKPKMHTFENYRKVHNALIDAEVDMRLSEDDYDELMKIMTLNSETLEIKKQCNEKLPNIKAEYLEVCLQLNKKGAFSGWHSLSLKAMKAMIPELYETSKNQMQIIHTMQLSKVKIHSLKQEKYINSDAILKEIYNPIAARSIRQTIKVTNAILKKHGELDSVIIEMPREYQTSEEEKKMIEKFQRENEKEKKAALIRAREEYAFPDEAFRNHKELATKLRLWYQQDQFCLYSGKRISIVDLVREHNMFEVDHIIPQSISLDDSLNNKVLCFSGENQRKGQQTPFYYYKSKSGNWTYEQYKQSVEKLFQNKKISNKKKELLLFEEDINKWDVRRGFIARNLVDTRYASRVVLNSFQQYFSNRDMNTKVKVVRGKFTSQLRKKWGISKNRNESHSHHAVDALIVAATANLRLWNKASTGVSDEGKLYDKETGEILPFEKLTIDEYNKMMNKEPFLNFKTSLQGIEERVKYSYKVSKKANRKISDATIYSTREWEGAEYVVGKIKNIYDTKTYVDQFKKRYIKNKEKFLMYQHDPQTFAILEEIMNTYPDADNPFLAYKKEHGLIRKYSKKGEGAPVTSLKFIDNALGQKIDITDKNKAALPKNKKVVLQSITPYRADVYYDEVKNQFYLIGVKYSLFSFSKQGYLIDGKAYQELLENAQIHDEMKFCFSLYREDIIEFGEDTSSLQRYRFWSKSESGKNRIEVKPIEKAEYPKQTMPTITKKTRVFNKYQTDVLGNLFKVEKEKDPRITLSNIVKIK
ncbi:MULTISPECIES: type II CRISPR RNA-guided endonuclease Cas9 [Listeria]|uniref:type II CRISPR RNA-guided endonuclease Cas9 n=1 Tax=Listeria TaxID=1637 RepID=UPI000B58948D|nr:MULTISPECIES: type II CRISPR RNA-guided endonuclease Cas9 [Listeria]